MEPPFPVCPSCGERFETAGIYRPKGDETDVVAYFHGDGPCDDVWARLAGDHAGQLERLGTLSDYDHSDAIDLIQHSDVVNDLTREKT